MKHALLLTILLIYSVLPGRINAQDDVFNSNGVKIRYVTAGSGEPVVLIHGWMADAGMWGKLDTNPAANEFQLISLDLRRHGNSDKPHDEQMYGAEMAEDVVRLLDHLKLPKAHLVGYSSGCYIAGKVAATYPERVLSVVYGGQAPVTEGGKPGDFSEVEMFASAVEEGEDLGAYIKAVSPASRPKPTEDQAKAIARFMYGGKDVKAFAAAGLGFKNLEVTSEQLRKCQAPVLFIYGGNESDHVKHRVATVRELLGRGEFQIVDGADHMTTLTNPQFGSSILDFLRSAKSE